MKVVLSFTRDNKIETLDIVPLDEGKDAVIEVTKQANLANILTEEIINDIFDEKDSVTVEVTDELTLNIIFGEW